MNIIKTIKIFAVTLLLIAIKAQASFANDYTILAFGDSLTAGYGLLPEQGFTAQLEKNLKKNGLSVKVINAGVSGDTSSAGLSRLEWVLSSSKPDLFILELGANDALRGITPNITRLNIDKILAHLEQKNIKTLVTGMFAPPNMGTEYGAAFNSIYPELSLKYNDQLYPFFLNGVAGEPSLNQSDAIHPNTKGVSIIVEKITPYILRIMRKTP